MAHLGTAQVIFVGQVIIPFLLGPLLVYNPNFGRKQKIKILVCFQAKFVPLTLRDDH
jgi:hypothetical protein